ncbi:MAG TPA: VacJ family lipoprotein [Woeseiaceae bacterium]|nr:VacJ family lipoprotein [Woeseiaceae bacterium]
MQPCRKSLLRPFLLTMLLAPLLGGCASQPEYPGATPDPLEPVNRVTYQFNDTFDRFLLKPVAKGYKKVTPSLVRQGVGNFFGNLGYPFVIFNNLLQGKPGAAVSDTGRLLVNTTVGLGGLIDVASDIGLEEHKEDLGQTLAVWGVPAGPYVVIPFLGPATLRDAVSRPADIGFNGLYYIDDRSLRDKLFVLEIIDMRARLLAADSQIEASNDPYLFVRSSYLQRREYLIYDGDPPMDDFFEEQFLDEDGG